MNDCPHCRDWGHTEDHAAHAGNHDHVWERRQNVTSKGTVMPAYEVCTVAGCGAARSADLGHA